MKNQLKPHVSKHSNITNLMLFLYCSFFILSCNSPSLTNTTHYEIESLKNSKEQFIFEEPLSYIPLETNQDCLIGSIYKIILTKDYIFIISHDLLYQFDISGKYIRKIGTKGRGPAEYGSILDVSVDESFGNIYICDNSGQKINIYNFSGEYLGRKTSNGLWKRFEVINNMLVINPLNYSGNEQCMLKLIEENDSTTCFKNNIVFKQQDLFLAYDVKNFQKLNNELIFHQQFNDTIYRFDPKSKALSISYYFDFGNSKFPIDLLGSLSRFNDESSKYGYLSDVCENNSYVFVTIFYKGENEKYVINKSNGKSFSIDINHDLIWPQWSDERGTLVANIQANSLLKRKDEILDNNLKSIASKMKDEDNPLIVLIK
jgi:hypothetical protein